MALDQARSRRAKFNDTSISISELILLYTFDLCAQDFNWHVVAVVRRFAMTPDSDGPFTFG